MIVSDTLKSGSLRRLALLQRLEFQFNYEDDLYILYENIYKQSISSKTQNMFPIIKDRNRLNTFSVFPNRYLIYMYKQVI